MDTGTKVALFWLMYIAIAFVVFGFATVKMLSAGGAALIAGAFVAAAWPVSGLIWLGVWLA